MDRVVDDCIEQECRGMEELAAGLFTQSPDIKELRKRFDAVVDEVQSTLMACERIAEEIDGFAEQIREHNQWSVKNPQPFVYGKWLSCFDDMREETVALLRQAYLLERPVEHYGKPPWEEN